MAAQFNFVTVVQMPADSRSSSVLGSRGGLRAIAAPVGSGARRPARGFGPPFLWASGEPKGPAGEGSDETAI